MDGFDHEWGCLATLGGDGLAACGAQGRPPQLKNSGGSLWTLGRPWSGSSARAETSGLTVEVPEAGLTDYKLELK